MYKYSKSSELRLASCHIDLQLIFRSILHSIDHTIIEGYRNQVTQEQYFKEGKSKVHYPAGKHNKMPSMAVDVAPFPIDWEDHLRFTYFAGFVMATAYQLKASNHLIHTVRWGGDWNMDMNFANNKFNDLVHFELIEPKNYYEE